MKIANYKNLILSFIICSHAYGQTGEVTVFSGIYITHSDFKNKKLTYKASCREDKNKFRLHDFFSKPYFNIIHKGVKYTHQKKEVYAYHDCNNEIFRFFNNEDYKIEEAGPITIYSKETIDAQSKSVKTIREFYFSSMPEGEIRELSINNLKLTFPKNKKFHDLLDETFSGEIKINDYDTFNKTFKVNYIYQKSLKKTD